MVKLIERYLTEDIEAVKKQYPDIPDDVFNNILKIDPTYREGSNSVGKYGKWLLGLFKKDETSKSQILNRPELVRQMLETYDEYKNDRTKTIEKDINRFRSIQDMADAIENVGESQLSKKQAQRQAKKDKPYDMVFEGEKYAIFVPKNHEGDMVLASFGHSTKATWCTALDNENGQHFYDKYAREGGKYYVLINKDDYEDKYQFHFESDQFMDANDDPIDLDDFYEENPDVLEFFQKEGYSKEWFKGRSRVNEIVDQIGSSARLDGLWYTMRPREWDVLVDYFDACKVEIPWNVPDKCIKIVEGLLPKFNKMDDTEENKKELISHLIVELYNNSADTVDIDRLLSSKNIPIEFRNGYWWGEINEGELRSKLREYLDEEGYLDEEQFWSDIDIDLIESYVPDFGDEEYSDEDYDEALDNIGYDIEGSDSDERYFLFKNASEGKGQIDKILKEFLKNKFGGDNLQKSIDKIIAINFERDGDMSGPFEGINGEEILEKKMWYLYKVRGTQDEIEKYTGMNFRDLKTDEEKEKCARTLLEKIPRNEIEIKVCSGKEIKSEMWSANSLEIAVRLDKSKYYYFPYKYLGDFSDVWIKKLGLENTQAVDLIDLIKSESYKKKLTMKER